MVGQGSSNPCSRGGWGDDRPTLPAPPSQLGAGWLLAYAWSGKEARALRVWAHTEAYSSGSGPEAWGFGSESSTTSEYLMGVPGLGRWP